jgi:omega-amidase
MKEKFNVAIVQLDLAWENPTENIKKLEKFVINNDADLFVLPELFLTGFTMDVDSNFEKLGGKYINNLIDIATKNNSIICGSLLIKENYAYYNRFVFISANGVECFYDKKHLFRMGEENEYYTAGSSKVIYNLDGLRILPLICYDLRFPVWSRNVGDYDVLIYVANWPAPRRMHWDTLLRARAIENQCFVIGVNRIGTDGRNIDYNGGSVIIDPQGNTVNTVNDNTENIAIGQIDMSVLTNYKTSFPAWKDRDDFQLL